MKIAKVLRLIVFFSTTIVMNKCVFAMQQAVVSDASYCVPVSNNNAIIPDAQSFPSLVKFYTYKGELLKSFTLKESNPHWARLVRAMLDPQAPKPQPVTCHIKLCASHPDTWIIFFYDVNGNQIQSYDFDLENKQIRVQMKETITIFPFDLLKHRVIASNFPLDLCNIQEFKIQQHA